jgi:hypothetical protein
MFNFKLCYDRRSVGQSVLESGHSLGLMDNFFSLHKNYIQTFPCVLLWDVLPAVLETICYCLT